jgi:predicted nucleic acid-binding protein
MKVYVESNFVLELAFLQEEHEACQELLGFAESRQIQLVLPMYSLIEPYEVLVRRTKQRRDLHTRLTAEIRELARSAPYRGTTVDFQDITGLLLRSEAEEKQRLNQVLGSVSAVASLVPMNSTVIQTATAFQSTLSFSPHDAVVYASILADLTVAPEKGCFITRNSKDFANPDIEQELARYECQLLWKFVDGLGYVRSHL